MQIPENSETTTIAMDLGNGVVASYVIPVPYTAEMFAGVPEGLGSHDILARKANQTLREDIANNIRRQNKSRLEKEPQEEILSQADVDAYIESYEPGVRAAGTGPSVDPVEKKMVSLIKHDLKIELKAKKGLTVAGKGKEPKTDANGNPTQITFDKFEALVERVMSGPASDKYRAAAEKALEDANKPVVDSGLI